MKRWTTDHIANDKIPIKKNYAHTIILDSLIEVNFGAKCYTLNHPHLVDDE